LPPPRLTRVITRLNIGGPARQEIPLSEALARLGLDDELVHGVVGPHEGELPVPEGVTHHRLRSLERSIFPVRDARAFRALVRHLRERKPDVVHTHMAKAGALGRAAAKRASVPVVVHTFHGHVLEGYFSGVRSRAILSTERMLARSTDALVAVSPAVRTELLDLGVGAEERWHVVPLGLDLRPFQNLPRSEDARRKLGLPLQGPIIGCVGRLVPIKNHEAFLDAAARVLREEPGATFVVAGDGELRGALQGRAARTLGDRCRFLGWVLDLPALYAALDLVVLTSRNEGTPVALLEAGVAGRPVVATNVGGVSDAVEDGITGSLTPPGSPDAVARAILTLLRDPERMRRMGALAAARLPQRHSLDRTAKSLAKLYEELLHGSARDRSEGPNKKGGPGGPPFLA
jgi:glycosyltransferase involved in cell wall biosynthesis